MFLVDTDEAKSLLDNPYSCNRSLIALLDVALLVVNGFWIHQMIATSIIQTPQSRDVMDHIRLFNKQTQSVSDAFIDQIEEENLRVRAQINQTFQRRQVYTMTRLEHNAETIGQITIEQQTLMEKYEAMAYYVRAWSRIGNDVPYREGTSEGDMLELEVTLLLQNGTIVQTLSEQFQVLDQSIRASVNYHLEYLNDLTGRPLDVLDRIQDPLEFTNLRGGVVDIALDDFRDELVVALQQFRDNFAAQYAFLKNRLEETQLAFEDLAQTYESLYDLVQTLNTVLQQLDAGTFGIVSTLLPQVDLDRFPPVEFYRPQVVALPDASILLRELDELISGLEVQFDMLGDEILANLREAISTNVQQVYSEFANALLFDDYDPPPIVFGGKPIPLQKALQLQSEITANITRQATLPLPPLSVDEPLGSFPLISPFANTTLSFTRPTVDLLSWRVPNIGDYILVFDDILTWVVQHWTILEPAVVTVYRAGKRMWEYFEGTAVPLPVIDLRTQSEKCDKKKRRKRAAKLQRVMEIVFNPIFTFIISRVVPVLIFCGFIFAGIQYYTTEYAPNCVHSNRGTKTGHDLIDPVVFNQAAAGGESRAIQLSAENHVYVQTECQTQYASTYDIYSDQTFMFGTRRAQAERFSERVKFLQQVVDFDNLCNQHREACFGSKPEVHCPTDADGIQLVDPCPFSSFDASLSNVTLLDPLITCNALPTGQVVYQNTMVLVMAELSPQESWCRVEWWVLSRLWQFSYIVGSYITLLVAFMLLIQGIQVFFWRYFRPEEYHIHCTSTRKGKFTQPEYLDEEAKIEAIEEWEQANRFWGIAKLGGSTGMIFGWIGVTILIASTDTTPVWEE